VKKSWIAAGALLFAPLLPAQPKGPVVAVITEDLSGSADAGNLEMVESLAESGVMESPGVSLVTRKHFEKILSEQGLAYSNVVNDRARLGRLAGADILLVVGVTRNKISQARQTNSAYGITETKIVSWSEAALSVKAIGVENGQILLQRQISRHTENRKALDACAQELKTTVARLPFPTLAVKQVLPRHKVLVKPTAAGRQIEGLDVFVDGNFIGNTPITIDVEEGVREISLRKGKKSLWDNRIQIEKEVWLSPDLGD
jgi:hypothetical protein